MLHAIASEAVRAFQIADNPVDEDLLADLEKMAARTHAEIEVLAAKIDGGDFANSS